MKKVLFYGEYPPFSLNGVAISNQINIELLKINLDVTVVIEKPNILQHKKITSYKFFNNINNIFTIIAYTHKNSYDYFYLVYSNSFFGALKSLFYILIVKLFNKNCKIIMHVHRGDLFTFLCKSKINNSIFDEIAKRCNKIILLSNIESTKLANRFYFHKIFVLKNCINKEASFKERNNLKIKFIFISNYILEKGILDLLKVFSIINENVELECYGNFADSTLKNQILSYNKNNIRINGPIQDEMKFQKLANSDCLILPSHNEGMPLILIEAMATGTPFIATNVGFIKENVYSDYPLIYNVCEKDGIFNMINSFLLLSKKDRIDISYKLIEHYNLTFSQSVHTVELQKIFS